MIIFNEPSTFHPKLSEHLTDRQNEAFTLLASGLEVREVAHKMSVNRSRIRQLRGIISQRNAWLFRFRPVGESPKLDGTP